MDRMNDICEQAVFYIDEHINFYSPWLWMSFGMLLINVLIWLFINYQIKKYSDLLGRTLLFFILLVSTLVEKSLFIQLLHIEPMDELRYEIRVVISTTMFYISLFVYLLNIYSMKDSFMDPAFINKYYEAKFYSNFMELAFSLAYGSVAGYFYTTLNFFAIGIRAIITLVALPYSSGATRKQKRN